MQSYKYQTNQVSYNSGGLEIKGSKITGTTVTSIDFFSTKMIRIQSISFPVEVLLVIASSTCTNTKYLWVIMVLPGKGLFQHNIQWFLHFKTIRSVGKLSGYRWS